MVAVLATFMAGCATTSGAEADVERSPEDPLEAINRPIFVFNDALDTWILRPVARGYDKVAPKPVKIGIANIYDNLNAPIWALNHALQGEFVAAGTQLGRFAINSTLGLLGLIDAAKDAGLNKDRANFNQTFGKWGIPNGPYLMLPFLGPSSVRGATALAVRWQTDVVVNYFDDNASVRDKLLIMELIDGRRRLLPLDKTRDEAPDEYILVREAYLSGERFEVYGAEDRPVELDFEDEIEEDFEEE
jgi:phospholipid-binding lipoprotein MlaA